MTTETTTTKPCHHCALTGATEPGPAEHAARWVDADGEVSDEVVHVCSECLAAGSSSGPGYRAEAVAGTVPDSTELHLGLPPGMGAGRAASGVHALPLAGITRGREKETVLRADPA